jgi:hypothetical protein
MLGLSQPHFGLSVKDETHTPKNGNLESSRTPENSKLDCRGQNTLHWGVIYTLENFLKFRCPNWLRMSHLDICSLSYGQKKGRELNWQFDSWPLKVENQPESDIIKWNATRRWKALKESYKITSNLIPIGGLSKKLWMPKVPGVQTKTVSGLHFGSPGKKMSFGCSLRVELQRILYGGRWWFPPSPGRSESSESKLSMACPNTKGVLECELTNLWLVLDAGSCNKIIVPLPSLIPKLLAHLSHPL